MWEKNSGRKQGISRFPFFLGGVALGGVPQDSHDLRCSKLSPPKHPHYHISNVGCVWSFQKIYTLRSTNIAIEKCTIFMVISRKMDFPMALYQFTRGYQTNSSNLPWHPSMIPIFVSSSEQKSPRNSPQSRPVLRTYGRIAWISPSPTGRARSVDR